MPFLKNILKRRRTVDSLASGGAPKPELFDPCADCDVSFSNITDMNLTGHPRPTGFYAAYYAELGSSKANVGFYTVPTVPNPPNPPAALTHAPTNPSPKTRRARRRACVLFDRNGVPINSLEGTSTDHNAQVPPPPSSDGSQYSVESGESPSRLPVDPTPKTGMTITRPSYGRSMSLDQGDKLIKAPSYRRKNSHGPSAGGSSESGFPSCTTWSDKPLAGFMSLGGTGVDLGGDMEYIPLHQTLDRPLTDDLMSPVDNSGDIGADMGYVPLHKSMSMNPSTSRQRYR